MKKLTLLFIFLTVLIQLRAQVIITPTPTASQIAHALTGVDVDISNLTVTAGNEAYGLIDAEFNPTFYGQGFALTNGGINNLNGPNNNGSEGTDLSLPGDSDLTVAMGLATFDASIIEFDISTANDTLLFYYVFGSEEYPEFVDGSVNDGFGVFISGPGISGTYTNNAANFALIPGTSTPVSINELNNGQNDCAFGGPAGPCSNCQYYVNNCSGTTFQYDGMTTLLEGIVPVVPDSIYHVKLAIADGGDGVWDSGVLFPEGAFRTTTLDFTGIEEAEQNLLTLYPNPAGTFVTLSIVEGLTKNSHLQIHNAQGQLVTLSVPDSYRDEGPQTIIDISSFAPGIYFLTLTNEEQTLSRKFIKQ